MPDPMPNPMRLSLDHITAVDATPSRLAQLAGETGCAGMCLFLQPMEVLPDMPPFELIGDTPERRATRDAMLAGGVSLDLVYPFTLTGRTDVTAFEPALETAAWLGARLANVLCYDRDAARRADKLAELAALAGEHGLDLAIEFYPPSQVRTLADAFAAIEASSRADIGVTLDLLHLVRGGTFATDRARLADPRIRIAQLADGPAAMPADKLEWEAGLQRLIPGEGEFPTHDFLRALAPAVPLSVEVPQQAAIRAGIPIEVRAARAVDAARRMLRGAAQ